MITVQHPKYGLFDCKPLQFIWSKFPDHYGPHNTIMCAFSGVEQAHQDWATPLNICNPMHAFRILQAGRPAPELRFERAQRLGDPPLQKGRGWWRPAAAVLVVAEGLLHECR